MDIVSARFAFLTKIEKGKMKNITLKRPCESVFPDHFFVFISS